MTNKRYKTISEVSELLNINKHVIRYWDSKFQGLSLRLRDNKQRLFNSENIKKIEEIRNLLYHNGQHNYSLDLANKIINQNKKKTVKFNQILKKPLNSQNSKKLDIKELREISENLSDLLKL